MSTSKLTDGLCVGADVDLWFPQPDDEVRWRAADAIAICRRCPSSRTCHDYAVQHGGTYGVYGGIRWNHNKPHPAHVKAMNELWVAQGLPPVAVPGERLTDADRRWFDPGSRQDDDGTVVAMPAPKQATTTRPLTIDERRRLRAADAMDVSA